MNSQDPAALRRRKLRAWRSGLLLAAAILLLFTVPLFAADLVVTNVPELRLPLAVGAGVLAVGLLVSLRGFRRYLIAVQWLALVCLLFAFRLMWPDLVLFADAAALSAFYYFAHGYFVHGRPVRGHEGERAPVLFRDDGERIVIYPDRGKLSLQVAYCVVLATATFGSPRLFTLPSQVAIALGLLGAMALTGLVPVLIRLVHRWPSLIVTSDGIIDQASAYLTGFGLIPWDKIDGVYAVRGGWRQGWYVYGQLVLITPNDDVLRARHSPLKRVFLRLVSQQMIGDVHISTSLLSPSPADTVQRITTYVKTHAPPGYLDPEDHAETSRATSDETKM